MLRTTLYLSILLLALTQAIASADNPDEFRVESPIDGSTFSLSEHRGRILALHFLLKTECPYCQRYTQSYAAQAAKTKNVVHVFLKPDSADEIRAWTAKLDQKALNKLPAIFRDPDAGLAKQYQIPDGYQFHGQVVHFPAVVVLDEQGKELFRHVGKNNSDRLSYDDFRRKLTASRSQIKR